VLAIGMDVCGWAGGLVLISAYALVSFGRISAQGAAFQSLNLIGSLMLAANSAWHGAWPSERESDLDWSGNRRSVARPANTECRNSAQEIDESVNTQFATQECALPIHEKIGRKMPELIAGLIDVFADAPLTGNPLAVVQDADGLSDEQMRRIAGELNQAETTFILQSVRADGRLRSFTASGAEVFGAGHNALGAWLWLGEHGDLGPLEVARTLHQEIGSEVLPIELQRVGGRVHGQDAPGAIALIRSAGRCGCTGAVTWTRRRRYPLRT